MRYRLVTPHGRDDALAHANALEDSGLKQVAARIRSIVAEAVAGDLRKRLTLAEALNTGDPTQQEIADQCAALRLERELHPRQTNGAHTMVQLQWKQRAVRSETDVARRRTYTTKCGRYRVVVNDYKLASMPRRIHSQVYEGDGFWEIISARHRELEPAKEACAGHAAIHPPMVTDEVQS